VQAVGTGGYPPYTFKWEDGSTSATRTVCPTSSTNYSTNVTDTGTVGEFARAAETVQASLTADALACPDGGVADSGASADGGLSGCVTLPDPIVVSPSSCTGDAGAAYGTFTLPFQLDAGGSYTLTMTTGSNGPGAISFYGITPSCGIETLDVVSTQQSSTVPQIACLHPQQTYSSLGTDFTAGWAFYNITVCEGCGQ
jgi:hypothetical protein